MSAEEFKHESLEDSSSIAQYLQVLIEGIQQGHLEFGTEQQQFDLDPKGLLQLEVRAKKKGGRNKISLKLSWRDDQEKTSNSSESLTIRSA